jgi:hypothetical protein
MKEVNVESIDLGEELGKAVDLRFEPTPVVLVFPVLGEGLYVLKADTEFAPIGFSSLRFQPPGWRW